MLCVELDDGWYSLEDVEDGWSLDEFTELQLPLLPAFCQPLPVFLYTLPSEDAYMFPFAALPALAELPYAPVAPAAFAPFEA